LESGIFASGDLAIIVKVLNIENLLDGLEAGSSVSLGGEDWGNTSVGGG